MENFSLEVLRRCSQILLWVSIILPIIVALTVGARYYIESEIGKRTQNNQTTINTQLSHELEQSKKELTELKLKTEEMPYQEYSQYGVSGYKRGVSKISGVIINPSPLNDWGKEFLTRDEDKFHCTCSQLSIDRSKSMIKNFPEYPFPYYFLSLCLKEHGDKGWVEYAKKAHSILQKTTKYPGHAKDHDIIFIEVNKLLKE